MSLAWPWSGRSLPKGNQWECWDSGLGPNVGSLPVLLPPSDQPKVWQIDISSHGWLARQLQLASWLADCYQTKCQPYPLPDRDILRPCVWWSWSHRPDVPLPLVDTAHGQAWNYCKQAALQSDVPPTWDCRPCLHLVRCQVWSTDHHVRCTLQLKKVMWTWKDGWPHGWLLHHKWPFTQEGNYLGKMYKCKFYTNILYTDVMVVYNCLFSPLANVYVIWYQLDVHWLWVYIYADSGEVQIIYYKCSCAIISILQLLVMLQDVAPLW